MGGMTKAVESGMPKLHIEQAAAPRQARIDKGEEVIVGVNKYQTDSKSEVEILDIDNTAVREAQIKRLKASRVKRDANKCKQALDKLVEAAENDTGNLLTLAVDAARYRASVGEISDALEGVWGRHRAISRSVSGVYGSAYADDQDFKKIIDEVEQFSRVEGRRPRILVCKLGQDGHDRGAKVIATAFADMGFDVDIGPLFQLPQEAVREAIENDVQPRCVRNLWPWNQYHASGQRSIGLNPTSQSETRHKKLDRRLIIAQILH